MPENRGRRLSTTGWIIVVVICAAILGAALYRYDPFKHAVVVGDAAPPPVAVTTASATIARTQDELTFVGTLVALRRITITPYTSGHVIEILVEDGTKIEAGVPLYRLDDRTAQAERALAQGKVDLAIAKLKRDQTLQREGFLAQVSVGSTGADLAEAEVELRLKQLNLELLTIKAPFAGRLERHKVAIGQYVSPGDAMVDLVDLGSIAADFHVPERQLPQIEVGGKITFESKALHQKFSGSVSFISSVIDLVTRNFFVRATVDGTADLLRPGLFGQLRLAVGAPRESVVVPEEALIQQLTGSAVYRIVDGRARLVQVETGTRGSDGVEVSKGLSAGDQVVSSGQFRLRDGDQVVVQTAAGT